MSGGSGGSSAPTQQTVTNTNVPDYARPYVEDMLGRSQALTDTNQNPYQQYTGQRIAGPTALQNQAASTAANMQPSWQTGAASGIAQNVAGRAQSAGQYTPGSFSAMGPMMTGTGSWNGQAASAYMNPYMQQVVDVQKNEAGRQSAMQGQQQGADAVANGAYGGTRDALVNSERERNLGILDNNIQAQGANAAWQQAQQQFNTDQGRGLQSQMANQGAWTQYGQQNLAAQQMGEQSRQYGSQAGLAALNTQLNASNALESAGQQQYGQQMGIAGLQNQIGQQQQATQQAGLDANYQNFVNQQMYPYRQLEFQNNLVHGNYSPNTTTSVYGGYGSPASQLAGLGTAAYGMSKMMAEGGLAGLPAGKSALRDDETYLVPYDQLSRGRKMEIDLERRQALEQAKKDYAPRSTTERVVTNLLTQHPFVPQNMREQSAALDQWVDSQRAGHIQAAQDAADYKDVGPHSYYGDDVPHKIDPNQQMFAAGGQVPGLAGLLISQIA